MLLLRVRSRRTPLMRVVVLLLVSLLTTPAAAQDGLAEDGVFAPFVTRLRLSIRDPQVRVTWEDAPGIDTDYRVYRSTGPITNETLDEAELVATVSAGDEAYIDVPPAPGEYHYAVLAETPTGTPYRVVIPGRNASYRAVAIDNVALPEERAARVERIDAALVTAQGSSAVEVTATTDRGGREIAVFRSVEPIADLDDLANASLVRELGSGSVRLLDLPVPGVPYYYAAVDTGLLLAGGARIVPGTNATVVPVEIPLRTAATAPGATAPGPVAPEQATPATAAARGMPLPFLQLQNRLATGARLGDPRVRIPDERPISPRTDEAITALLDRVGPRPADPAAIAVLAVDRIPDPQGAEYTLRTIIDGPIRRMAWEEALGQIDNYLTLPLTDELEARARFYRAQAYYFTGQRQRAILEFLLARQHFYVESGIWLDRILDARGV